MANVTEPSRSGVPQAPIPLVAQEMVVSPAQGPQSLLLDPHRSQMTELCKAMFRSPVTVEPMFDPSEPADIWLCFNVSAVGSDAEILKRELDWHEKVEQLTGERSGKYRLSIYPVE